MAGKNRVNVEVGFSVDKSGLSEMQSYFQQIANKAKEPGNELNASLQKAGSTAATLDKILEKTFNTDLGSLNVTKFNQELSKSGLTLKDVKANLTAVGNDGATAYNRLSQAILGTNMQLKQSSKLLDSMFVTFKNTVRYGISSSIFNNFTNAIQRAYDYSRKLNTSLNDIRIVTDKSAESMSKFAEQANQAAKGMGASTLDYTNAALIYYQQGLDDAEVQARAETTIKAANVTGQTGQEVSEQLTAVWNGYKVTAEETELYVDKLAAVAATTAADLEELSTGMSKVAAAANAMGVDFDDLNAQIATIVSVTRQAPESVGTALKTIYARLGDLKVDGVDEFGVKLGEVSAQMQTMGIQILDQEGNLRDMSSVIAEVAQKWGTWTEAQRQAAAVAMAGKRQYNNLIALFDNWGMYTKALETSAEAMGTLQHQQDIYMESTAAKLQTLKATWQDLYAGLIDDDELNAGIEGLTNLVQVFDNFIDSFGGGIKSISAFGAVLANVFNRQISDAINGAIQRQEVFKQNLALAQANAETRAAGVGSVDGGATSTQIALQENSKIQLEYAEKIYNARVGLNQEQYNSLVQYQKELGSLQGELTYLDEVNKKYTEKYLGEEQFNEILKEGEIAVYQIQGHLDENILSIKNAKKEVESILAEALKLENIEENISSLNNLLDSQGKKELENFLNQNKELTDIQVNENEILKILDKQVNRYESAKKVAEQVNENRLKTVDLEGKIQNTRQEADEMLRLANSAQVVTQRVITLTSALGTMAMAWSSINSLVQTWNDENASFGDKITQTFMTLGMTIPMVISSFNKLKDVFGISSSLLDVYNAKLIAKGNLEKANIATTNAATLAEEARIALTKTKTMEDAKDVGIILSKIGVEEKEAIVTGKLTVAEVANNIANKEGLILDTEQVVAIGAKIIAENADTVAKNANTAATTANAAAQTALNASMLAFPGTWIIAALAAIVGVAAIVNAHYKKLREEAHKLAEEKEQLADKTRNEIETQRELIKQYNELKEKYDDGTASKEDLWEITGKLLESYDLEGSRLDMIAGKYDKVTAAIKRKQKAKQDELLDQDEESIKAQAEAALEEGRKAGGSGRKLFDSNKYQVTLDSGLANSPGDYSKVVQKAKEIFGEDITYSDGVSDYINSFTFDTSNIKNIMEGISKLEQWRDALKELGYETEPAYQSIEKIINSFNDEGSLDKVKENQAQALQDIFSNSILSLTKSQSEFDNEIKNLQQILQNALSKGIIPSDTDINKSIADYIGTLNTELATNFTIEQGIKEKFPTVKEDLLNYFKTTLDKDTQLKIVDIFDFSIDTKKGKELIDNYKTFFENQMQGMSILPAGFQSQLNETILKGKDISKSDWESLTAMNPNAEEVLGDKDNFNNKSIGERIALMEQLNELTRENNTLAIEQYDETKKASDVIIDDLNKQIELLQEKAQNIERSIGQTIITKDAVDEARENIREIQSEIEELTNEKHEVEISVDMEQTSDNLIQSMIGDVITQTDQIISATEAIGEGWKVAAEDVAQFASAFPDLMDEVQFLEDGSLQLSKDLINNVLDGNKQIIDSNKEVVIQSIDDKIAQLTAEKEFQDEKIKILQQLLDGTMSEQQAEDNIKEAGRNYESTLREQGLIEQANAVNESIENSEQGATGIINTLDAINEAIQTIHANYANMLVEGASMQSLSKGVSAGVRVNSNFNKQTSPKNNDLSEAAKAQIQSELEAAVARSSAIDKEIASYYGLRSEILSKNTKAGENIDRVKAGKAGKESKDKKGGGKDKKEKELKEFEDEFDRYWELKKAIDATDRSLKRLEKDKENYYGYQLIDALKKENALLETQRENYERLAEAQRQEAAELRNQLGTMGVMFDASGAITNYAAATAQALAAYNAAIQQYNAGLIDETTLGVYEKAYENFKKLLDRYDKLYYTELKETEEKLDEIRRKEIANNLKAWEVELDVKLNFKELKRGWNDFIKEINEDFKKVYKNLRVEVDNLKKNAKTFIGSDGTLTAQMKAIREVMAEIDKMRAGGKSDMFESISQAQEKLKELNEMLQDSARALHDLWKEAWEALLDGIDQVADKFEDLMDRFDRINEELEFQRELVELLYGEEAYGLMDSFYKGQEKSLENQLQSVKQQVDMWKQQFEQSGASMDKQEEWTEEQKKLYEQWMEAQGKLNDLTLEYIKMLKEDYSNTVSKILKELDMSLGGKSIKDMRTEWERISAYSSKYLDDVEQAYEAQKLNSKITQSIADTNNLKAQQKLEALRDKEVKYLREKKNLTQYDLDAAEARYQIALKEIALEEAQNNKTSMKLVRNEQGNWSYQYTADEEDVATKQQDLLDSYNNLYQLASNAYESNLESMLELKEQYLERSAEISNDDNLNEQQKFEQLDILRKQFEEDMNRLVEENTLYRQDLRTSAAAVVMGVYEADHESIESMTEEQKALLNELINEQVIPDYMTLEKLITEEGNPEIQKSSETMMKAIRQDWSSSAQQLANMWNADDGKSVKAQLQKAYNAIIKATEEYKKKVDWCAEAVGRDFGEEGIKGAIDKAADATDNLKDKTEDLVNDGTRLLADLRKAVEDIEDAWKKVQDQIQETIRQLEEYLKLRAEANNYESSSGNVGPGSNGTPGAPGNGKDGGGDAPGKSGKGRGRASENGYDKYTDPNGAVGTYGITYGGKLVGIVGQSQKALDNWAVQHGFDAWRTGGYTGDWGNENGRLSILHQKELVLNKDDTANFLEGISIIRDMTSLNGSISNAITGAVGNMISTLAGARPGTIQNMTSTSASNNENNTFNITAEFPNANNVDDIRQALLSLPNLASQYVARNNR